MLVGGQSRRMGRDKATIEIDGEPMAGRVAGVLAGAGCSPVFVVGGDAQVADRLGRSFVADRIAGAGPLAGVEAALSAGARADCARVAVFATDLPAITVPVVEQLCAACRPGVDVAVAVTDRMHPLTAVWSVDAHDRVAAALAAGTRAVHELIGSLRSARVAVEPAFVRNVNSPADLAGLADGPSAGGRLGTLWHMVTRETHGD